MCELQAVFGDPQRLLTSEQDFVDLFYKYCKDVAGTPGASLATAIVSRRYADVKGHCEMMYGLREGGIDIFSFVHWAYAGGDESDDYEHHLALQALREAAPVIRRLRMSAACLRGSVEERHRAKKGTENFTLNATAQPFVPGNAWGPGTDLEALDKDCEESAGD